MDTLSRPIEYLLSGISSTSTIITRFIRSVRVAHADLAAVTRDLSDLRLLLELMREERGIPVLLQAQTLQLLWCCGNVLIHIDTILAQCSDTEKWISTGRAEMASCRDSLETFGEALGLALEVATLYEPYCTSPISRILNVNRNPDPVCKTIPPNPVPSKTISRVRFSDSKP